MIERVVAITYTEARQENVIRNLCKACRESVDILETILTSPTRQWDREERDQIVRISERLKLASGWHKWKGE